MSIKIILFLEQGNEEHKYQFDQPGIYTIGRGKDCSLILAETTDKSLSRQHCQIVLKNDEVFIRDAGSSNGTFVNGKKLPDGTVNLGSDICHDTDVYLINGDVFNLGNNVFQIYIVVDSEDENIPKLKTTKNGTIILPAIES